MEDKIQWCLRQKKGIELVKPSENLVKVYVIKAENALKSMSANKGNREWEISSGYYAIYFALYALLMRIGVKSEIHSCTIEFMKVYLKDHFTQEETELLGTSYDARIDAQYYTGDKVNTQTQNKIIHMAPDFVVKCKSLLSQIKEDEINRIRDDIKKRIGRHGQ